MMRRITQKDVADALGFHVSTVSKALKGDPAVAAATREQVRAMADELGFVPDPLLGALASYRKQLKPEAYHATIAWIYNHPRTVVMDEFADYDDYLAGAQARAAELGYRIEPFWVGDAAGSVASLERILQTRGMQGVIVAPQFSLEKGLALDWARYASVAIGYSLSEEGIDRVTNDHFATMASLLERLHDRGYHRVGCYLWETDNRRMGRRAHSAFAAFSSKLGGRVQSYQNFKADAFVAWARRGQFDAVVCRERRQMEVLLAAGFQIPDEIGFAGYALSAHERSLSGMQHNNRRIGAAAVEWLSGKLQRGQFGRSEYPQRLLITSQWLENESLL